MKSNIYLCKSDYSVLGVPSGFDVDSCILKKNAFDLWELTFEVDKFIEKNGMVVQSDYYDSLAEKMYLYLDSEKTYFLIDSEPTINNQGTQETKTVTAHSNECELSNRFLKNFKVNTGTFDSQEYLADNNVNNYTKLPCEYISLINYNKPNLSLLHLVLLNTGWKVKNNIPEDICTIKKSFELENGDIYSFLMKIVSPTCKVVFEFDRKNREVGVVKFENYGVDSGVNISTRNLLHNFDVSSSEDNIVTRLTPKGASDEINISLVNFGSYNMTNLDYFMNCKNSYGDYKYVSSDLHDKYNRWIDYRDTDLINYDGKEYTRRELYIYLTKLYEKSKLEINDLVNRLPNDGCNNDYTKWTYDDLITARIAYSNALDAVISIYKEETGAINVGDAPNYSPAPVESKSIKDTIYWNDFYSFKEILLMVDNALRAWCKTDAYGNLETDNNGKFIFMEFGNPDYYTDENMIKPIDAWLYEFSLYGLNELRAKKKAWGECASLLFHDCFILDGDKSNPISYRTPDNNATTGWQSLSSSQKGEFSSFVDYCNILNSYLDYMSFEERENSLVTYYDYGIKKQKTCKGIVRQCDDAISERISDINKIESKAKEYNDIRSKIANSVTIENCTIEGNTLFSKEDIIVIYNLVKEENYENSNIITTNLDDTIALIDIQKELYDVAYEKLYEKSRPQYSFSASIDNLFALEEFQMMKDSFELGNFIWLYTNSYDDKIKEKLRIISMSYNPIVKTEMLDIEFSTMTKSLNGLSDLAFLLGDTFNNSSSTSNSNSSNGNNNYGVNDANIQISNNVLNALLNTEKFATSVNDVILDSIRGNKANFNTLFAYSGIFDNISVNGNAVIGGLLQSTNYNGIQGSMINLNDGSFSLGNGSLIYNKEKGFQIKGALTQDDFASYKSSIDGLSSGTTTINGSCISTGNIVSQDYRNSLSDDNNILSNTKGSILSLTNGTFSLGGGLLKWDGSKLTVGKGSSAISVDGNTGTLTIGGMNDYVTNDSLDNKGYLTSNSLNGYITESNLNSKGYLTSSSLNGYVTESNLNSKGYLTSSSLSGYATLNSLSNGNTTIHGGCITTGNIKSNNYNGSDYNLLGNTQGSIIRLNDGTFNFGGQLKWDGNTLSLASKNCDKITYSLGFALSTPYTLIEGDKVVVWLDCNNGDKYNLRFWVNYKKQTGTNSYISYTNTPWVTDSMANEGGKYYHGTYNSSTGIVLDYSEKQNSDFTWYISDTNRAVNVAIKKVYCGYWNGTQNSMYYHPVKKMEIYNNNGKLKKVFYNANNNSFERKGIYFDSQYGIIDTSNYSLSTNGLVGFGENFSIGSYSINDVYNYNTDSFESECYFSLTPSIFLHKGIYDSTATGTNVVINSTGELHRSSSSSRRYKKNITTEIQESLNPKKLYDLDICQFEYKEGHLSIEDQRYGETLINFIAEDLYEKYPIACDLDENGLPESPNYSLLIAPMMKLIQEQHEDIEKLKQEIDQLKGMDEKHE